MLSTILYTSDLSFTHLIPLCSSKLVWLSNLWSSIWSFTVIIQHLMGVCWAEPYWWAWPQCRSVLRPAVAIHLPPPPPPLSDFYTFFTYIPVFTFYTYHWLLCYIQLYKISYIQGQGLLSWPFGVFTPKSLMRPSVSGHLCSTDRPFRRMGSDGDQCQHCQK